MFHSILLIISPVRTQNRGRGSGAIGTAYYMDAFTPTSLVDMLVMGYRLERYDVNQTLSTNADGLERVITVNLGYVPFILLFHQGSDNTYAELAPGEVVTLMTGSFSSNMSYSLNRVLKIATWCNDGFSRSTSKTLHFLMIIK